MQHMEHTIVARKQDMLSAHPEQTQLTHLLFDAITGTFREDFDAIASRKQRLSIIFNCISALLEKLEVQKVKKRYAIDVLGIFLDRDVVAYLNNILGEHAAFCVSVIKAARSTLHASQWSDPTSSHWHDAIDRFR